MKTKLGLDVIVVGQIQINSINHYIIQLPVPSYHLGSILYKHIVIPSSNFEIDNGATQIEIVDSNTN